MTTRTIEHESAWLAPDMRNDPSWIVAFDEHQRAELRDALATARARGRGFADLTPATFPLPRCAPVIAEARRALRDGRGFVLLRDFPVGGMSVPEAELAYFGFCAYLGDAVTQNAQGELIAHITDRGQQPGGFTRGYATANEAKFHIDLTDVVGLLCLRQAKEGGRSRIASSMSVLNAFRVEHPDLWPLLVNGFPWDRRGEQDAGEAPIGPPIPVVSERDGAWSCRYHRTFIETAYRRRGERVPPEVSAAFDAIDDIALRPEHVLEMDFRPGDIQLLSNDVIFHARTAFVDHPEPDRKRLLLRLWLQMHDPRPLADAALLRHALVHYGALGRTAKEIR